ncbi:hypothetical protein [Gryllotalpicola ginsengisoli]|uniref:hypothetical protein n=1 Tax=Gryllotalpicola ginsengisoli TaxID=444608 RepID=UPI0003B63A3E|nr:hypothetical protein [Gryllotalpicola ginsengisoli]
MSDTENDERKKNLSELASDAAHPFDQTNGIVEGLDGDADAPEHMDEKTGNRDAAPVLGAPAPGSQMPGGAVPVSVDEVDDGADDTDSSPA